MSFARLTRRATLFGVAALTAAPGVANVAPAVAEADRRLTAMAADICATLDGAAYAFDEIHDETDHCARLGRANALTLDMAALPAVGLPGVLAKAKAYLDSNSYDVLHLSDLADSLAEDVERVLEGLSA